MLLLVAGTEARRAARRSDVRRLVQAADQRSLARALDAQRLLAIGGARLEQTAGDLLDDDFRASWHGELRSGRSHALALEALTFRAIQLLEGEGIAAMPLKGPSLAAELYGDAGMRVSDDIDLLVHAETLPRAVDLIRELGYREAPLPPHPLHEAMVHADPWMPPIEVHWRIHWYESRFSEALLQRAVRDENGLLRPRPADQLAMLLLFFARDGFIGLRLAADVATCWDRYGGEIERGAVAELAGDHPELRDALVASALVADRLVGVPASELGIEGERASRRQRRAIRLANWRAEGDFHQLEANLKLVDWILTPPGGQIDYFRRQLLPRRDRPPALPIQVVHSLKLLVRYGIALWGTRGGRFWSPLPAAVNCVK